MKGLTNKYKPEHGVWYKMIRRCHNPDDRSYEDYGLEGITVCSRWRSNPDGFKNFLEDMGSRPEGKVGDIQLDRIDNNQGYSPWNCRWTTRRENILNKSTTHWITFRGITLCLKDWAKKVGLQRGTLKDRIVRYGWSIERALTEPAFKGKNQTYGKP